MNAKHIHVMDTERRMELGIRAFALDSGLEQNKLVCQ